VRAPVPQMSLTWGAGVPSEDFSRDARHVTSDLHRPSSSAPHQRRDQLPRVDGRTLAAKRYRALLEVCEAEFGAAQSSADRELYKTWVLLALHREQMEAALVRGDAIDHDALVRTSSEARRVWSALQSRAEGAAECPLELVLPVLCPVRISASSSLLVATMNQNPPSAKSFSLTGPDG